MHCIYFIVFIFFFLFFCVCFFNVSNVHYHYLDFVVSAYVINSIHQILFFPIISKKHGVVSIADVVNRFASNLLLFLHPYGIIFHIFLFFQITVSLLNKTKQLVKLNIMFRRRVFILNRKIIHCITMQTKDIAQEQGTWFVSFFYG